MTYERRIAEFFAMSDAAWARHANPWSGWTRAPSLPLLALAGWSREWIGLWALPAAALVAAWVWINPRLFAPPADHRAWMSRAVLGERLWLARDEVPVPAHHRAVPHLLSAVAGAGAVLAIWGVAVLEAVPLFTGLATNLLAKLWFLDRMVWLHKDMIPQ